MTSTLKYFQGSIVFAVVAVLAGAVVGFLGGGITGALTAAFLIAILGVLETSLSFDNAVVNAAILENWDEKWRKIFLTIGIIIAVFGMRLIFPIVIVSIPTGMSLWETATLAVTNPTEYGHKLHEIHYLVAGFGGAFLMMVALAFWLGEKQVYWWEAIEKKLEHFGQIEAISGVLTLGTVYVISKFMSPDHATGFFIAGFFGYATYVVAHGLGTLLGGEDDGNGGKVVRAGVAGFLYLELLDASFSFDGVIGAFAITNDIFVIMLGLAVGAFFVRSMTIFLVDKGTLTEYRYLEHGAFAAIAVLCGIMLMSGVGIEIPEAITGLLGAALIGLAIWRSVRANKAEAVETEAAA